MNKMISGVNRHFFKASGHFRISEPRAFLDRVVRYCETYDLPVSMTQADRLAIKTNMGSVNMRPVSGAVSIHLSAPNDGALHMLRETVAFQIETLEPTCLAGLEWHDEIAQGRLPPNFRMARVVSVSALGRSFWRLIVEGDDLVPFAWDGMHLRLALPARGAPVQWPRLNERGRAVWPEPQDLHVAVYTIRDIDLSIGRLTIDIFRHEGAHIGLGRLRCARRCHRADRSGWRMVPKREPPCPRRGRNCPARHFAHSGEYGRLCDRDRHCRGRGGARLPTAKRSRRDEPARS